jgi:hypothetical protein
MEHEGSDAADLGGLVGDSAPSGARIGRIEKNFARDSSMLDGVGTPPIEGRE